MNFHKIITVLLLALCVNCFSQHKLNVIFGYGGSLVQPPKQTIPGIEINDQLGNSLIGGLGYKYQFKKLIGLGVDLSGSLINGSTLYKRQGTTTWTNPQLTYKREEKNGFKLAYITAPVYVNFYYKRFSLDLGFQGAYAFYRAASYSDEFIYSNGDKSKTLNQSRGNNTSLLHYDYGFFTALNVNVSKRLAVFIRYYKGQQNIAGGYNGNLKNTQIIIGLRYNFFVSKAKNKEPEKAKAIQG